MYSRSRLGGVQQCFRPVRSMRPVAGVQLGQHASATTREMLARPPPTSPKALIIASTSGLPLVSTTIRSRMRRSSRDGVTESNNARASETGSPVTSSSGKPSSSWPGSGHRTQGRPTPPATGARQIPALAPKPDPATAHCASSTRHSNGRSPETSDSRLKTASPTRKRSGGLPPGSRIPSSSASRCARRDVLSPLSCPTPRQPSR